MSPQAQQPVYPGFGQLLRHYPQGREHPRFPMGMHSDVFGSQSAMLPVREVAMMLLMETLTEKPDWHRKVFDDAIVAKWRNEAYGLSDEALWKQITGGKGDAWEDMEDLEPRQKAHMLRRMRGIVSKEAFDFIILELQNKARYFEESGLVPTLDACATVVKSDGLVRAELGTKLRAAFKRLQDDQASSPDWHPGSDGMVQDLVHPSLYPLVYGRSKVFSQEVVGVADAIQKWAGKGDVIPEQSDVPIGTNNYAILGHQIPPEYWSSTYQWLPSNVAFQDDGSVKFTSYINNLHPARYPEIYRTVEELIETVLPAWDQCLALIDGWKKQGAGRLESRFETPQDPEDDTPDNWNPSDQEDVADVDVNFDEDYLYDWVEDEVERKWMILREPVVPNPKPFEEIDYRPAETLRSRFADSGLQIIVKMASIELGPEKPEFPAGGWHVEGQMNEHICATALYYLDSDNITDSSLEFRMQTSDDQALQWEIGQDAYHWLERVYGTKLGGGSGGTCLQNYGRVDTRQGRLLAFPNVFQHRVSPFRLIDPTKPGHRRFIALWLVDPHARVISTANVPPQQLDWWAESVFGSTARDQEAVAGRLPGDLKLLLLEKGLGAAVPAPVREALERDATADSGALPPRLPAELLQIVRANLDGGLLMSDEEARDHRAKLMHERSAFHVKADRDWLRHAYSFCEH